MPSNGSALLPGKTAAVIFNRLLVFLNLPRLQRMKRHTTPLLSFAPGSLNLFLL